MKNIHKTDGLVYSTEHGRMCPDCRAPQAQCRCHVAVVPAGDGVARVQREKRAGKVVTLVKGLGLDDTALRALGKQLRTACGAGGTVKDFCIEIQGEHGTQVAQWLQKQGFKVKLSG
jgi:translation initiation factor 1